MVRAIRRVAGEVKSGELTPEDITAELFTERLDTAGLPDPDLLIRPGGEKRISNYLLWQLAYAEFYFTDVMWPEFSKEDLLKACEEYSNRQRRFGKVK